MSELSTNGDNKTLLAQRIAITTTLAGLGLLVLVWLGYLSYKPGGIVLLASLPLLALGTKSSRDTQDQCLQTIGFNVPRKKQKLTR